MPFALAYLGFLHGVLGRPLPVPNMSFAVWAMVETMAQIAATFLLVHLFSFRNFAVGTAYSRTEPAQAALFALIFVGESVNGGTLAAIAISVAGVMLISVARTEVTLPPFSPPSSAGRRASASPRGLSACRLSLTVRPRWR